MTIAALACPVVHTGLNWVVIALLLMLIVAIVGAVTYSALAGGSA